LDRAFQLGLAALLAEKVYNFGELLSHSVINSLRGTENTWLVKLLCAFNAGDLGQFEFLRPHWTAQAELVKLQDILLNKIRLLSLMELTFRRHAHDRTISFADIASGAQVDVNEVGKF
jgi:26S proteasome regulatory subunit N9